MRTRVSGASAVSPVSVVSTVSTVSGVSATSEVAGAGACVGAETTASAAGPPELSVLVIRSSPGRFLGGPWDRGPVCQGARRGRPLYPAGGRVGRAPMRPGPFWTDSETDAGRARRAAGPAVINGVR